MCSRELEASDVGDWRVGTRTKLLYALAVVTSVTWIATLLHISAPFLVPTGIGGLFLCALFYLGPGLLLGLYANIQPKVRRLHCGTCHWTGMQERR